MAWQPVPNLLNEMHLYAEGGHALGLRPTAHPISGWPQLFETWLKTIHMLDQ